MIRVLHLIGPLTMGGAQTQLLGLLRAAHGRRWEATLCATAPGPMIERFAEVGVPVIELDRGRTAVGRVRQLRNIVSAGGFDVVHANLWHPNGYARLAVAGRRNRPRVVISERNVESVRSIWKRAFDWALAPWTDVWVGNSRAVCDFIRSSHPVRGRPVLHIPNAVDRSVFRPGQRAPSTTPLVVSVGRLDPEKGYEHLIEASRLLLARGRAIEVAIAGVGPLRAGLELMSAGLPVRFVGQLDPGAEVARFLDRGDVFVLPSTHREGLANVVLEALAVGMPVVTTRIPGMEQALNDGGLLVPPGDAEALAGAIERAIDDPTLRGRALRAAAHVAGFDELSRAYLAAFEGRPMVPPAAHPCDA